MTRVALVLFFTASVIAACSYVPPGASLCGNGDVDDEEQCDDANDIDGDGCDSNCTATSCGNGIASHGEECDDGNATNGDGCNTNCVFALCGDDVIQSGEECDDNNIVDNDGCDSNCTLTRCGNGVKLPDEFCDDGNNVNGDDCNATCTLQGSSTVFIGTPGQSGTVDGVGTEARVSGGQYMAVFGDKLFLGKDQVVRVVDIATRQVRTIAGSPGSGGYQDATNGADARFAWIAGIATDGKTIWVADNYNHVIRAISAAPPHTVTTIAGVPEYNTNAITIVDGPPSTARLGDMRGLAYLNGVLYFGEATARVLRGLDFDDDMVKTYAGTADAAGTNDGLAADARFMSPRYITSDGFLTLFISDTDGHKIRAYNTVTTAVTTVAGSGACGYSDGNASSARVHRPRGLTFDGESVYFTESVSHTIRQAIKETNSVDTLSGTPADCTVNCACNNPAGGYNEGAASNALWDYPYDIAFHEESRSLFVSDGGNHVIRRIQ